MIETGLAAAFGFIAALFLLLLIAPAIARRISEITWRHAIRVLPQSSEEIAAERDYLRGLNAIDMRKLEIKFEAVAESERLLRIGKVGLDDKIVVLANEKLDLKSEIGGLQAERSQLSQQLNQAVETNALLSTEAADRDVRLTSLGSDFAKLRNDHLRLNSALAKFEEAQTLGEQKLDLMSNVAAVLRSKLSTAESELRIAQTAGRRFESDLKLATRKILSLESKLERNIRLIAETEEKLNRRETELSRLKGEAKQVNIVTAKAVSELPLLKPKTFKSAPLTISPQENSRPLAAKIDQLRPALRVAKTATPAEKARLKKDMMELAALVTKEAASQHPSIQSKIDGLLPDSSPLGDEILRAFNKAQA